MQIKDELFPKPEGLHTIYLLESPVYDSFLCEQYTQQLLT